MKLLFALDASVAAVTNAQELYIPDTAIDAGVFDTLVAGLSAADLVGKISDPNGPFTVFAPTDDAFDALPTGLLGCLLEEVNKQTLTEILLHHVVDGQLLSTDLTDGMVVPTLEGEDTNVYLFDGMAHINDSTTVIMADVLTNNGVIHVIDEVLVPPSIDVAAFLETCDGSGSSLSFTSYVSVLGVTIIVDVISALL
jgi:uncharacterized surface protein with fasciclin (FAS1) repeats